MHDLEYDHFPGPAFSSLCSFLVRHFQVLQIQRSHIALEECRGILKVCFSVTLFDFFFCHGQNQNYTEVIWQMFGRFEACDLKNS